MSTAGLLQESSFEVPRPDSNALVHSKKGGKLL